MILEIKALFLLHEQWPRLRLLGGNENALIYKFKQKLVVLIPKEVRVVSAKFEAKHFLQICAVEDVVSDQLFKSKKRF